MIGIDVETTGLAPERRGYGSCSSRAAKAAGL
jgi:hypothetical protein